MWLPLFQASVRHISTPPSASSARCWMSWPSYGCSCVPLPCGFPRDTFLGCSGGTGTLTILTLHQNKCLYLTQPCITHPPTHPPRCQARGGLLVIHALLSSVPGRLDVNLVMRHCLIIGLLVTADASKTCITCLYFSFCCRRTVMAALSLHSALWTLCHPHIAQILMFWLDLSI